MSGFAIGVDIMLDGQWVDITGDVYRRDGISIVRGRPDEGSKTDPGECSLTIRNPGGKYSPRNPESPYYGLLGRNTPLRVRVGELATGRTHWHSSVDTQDHRAPSVPFSFQDGLRIAGWVTEWGNNVDPGAYTLPAPLVKDAELAGRLTTATTGRAAVAGPGVADEIVARYSVDSDSHATFQVVVPGADGPPVVEEVWADTRGNEPVRFVTGTGTQVGWWLIAVQGWSYDHPDRPGMPHQPGGTPGTWATIVDSQSQSTLYPRVKVWARPVSVAGAQEVTFQDDGTSFADFDNHARLYVLSGVPLGSVRFTGEVAAWPLRWHTSGGDVRTPIKAAGILRRLGQRAKPIGSAAYRQILSDSAPTPLAYWPCEDGEDASQIASALPGGGPMTITGIPDLASHEAFVASEPLPLMKSGSFYGNVPDYTPDGGQQVQWLMHIPADGTVDGQPIVEVNTSGTAALWEVRYIAGQGGRLQFNVWDDSGTRIHNSGNVTFEVDGKLLRAAVEVTQNGSDIDFRYGHVEAGATLGTAFGFTVAGRTFGRIDRVAVAPGSEVGGIGDVAMGHVTVHNAITGIFDLGNAYNAWQHEPAGRRIERLCREEGIPFAATGDLGATTQMGHQQVDTLLDLLVEAAETDGGVLHETRDDIGLAYRPRRSLYNQGMS